MFSKNEVLLGWTVHQILKWAKHVLYGNINLMKSLSIWLQALNWISSVAPFRTRKMVTEGVFTSKLIYLIDIGGVCEELFIEFTTDFT